MLRLLANTLEINVEDLLVAATPDLRRLRIAAGLSVREAADAAHMSQSTYARWETGRLSRLPIRTALQPLSLALGVSLPQLQEALLVAIDRRKA